MGPTPHQWFSACKIACLASVILVSKGTSPHERFLDAKHRLMDRNNKSLWVPGITCRFVHAKQIDLHQNDRFTWVAALICGFCMQNSAFFPRVQVSMGTRPDLSFCACKTAWFAPELQVYICCSPYLWFCACKTATLGPDLLVCMGPCPHL